MLLGNASHNINLTTKNDHEPTDTPRAIVSHNAYHPLFTKL